MKAFIGHFAVLAAVAVSLTPALAAKGDREAVMRDIKQKCFTSQPASQLASGKCECFARTFANSLSELELANPAPSAVINFKMATARKQCNIGE